MLIKNLEFDDYRRYRVDIKNLLLDSYRDDYDFSGDQITQLVDKKLAGLDSYIKMNAIIIGAISDAHLIGFIWIYQYNQDGEERFHFNEIVVDRNCRGMGIGEKLTKESLEIVKEKGIEIIDLMVAEDNQASRNLSEKQGFKTNKRYLVKRLKSESQG